MASFIYARCLHLGKGIKKDTEKAQYYYKRVSSEQQINEISTKFHFLTFSELFIRSRSVPINAELCNTSEDLRNSNCKEKKNKKQTNQNQRRRVTIHLKCKEPYEKSMRACKQPYRKIFFSFLFSLILELYKIAA